MHVCSTFITESRIWDRAASIFRYLTYSNCHCHSQDIKNADFQEYVFNARIELKIKRGRRISETLLIVNSRVNKFTSLVSITKNKTIRLCSFKISLANFRGYRKQSSVSYIFQNKILKGISRFFYPSNVKV